MMKTIVLIEDNADVRENTAEILELADYKVFTAENGKKGVELAKKVHPDLIVCDIMMPELDGYGVLHILSKNPETNGVPFIFLTAKADQKDFRHGMNLGADDYITKPFEETDLLDAIESRLKRSESFKGKQPKTAAELHSFIDAARGIEELKHLSDDKKTRVYHKKDTIYYEGDYPHAVYFISSGQIKTSKIDNYGKELITKIHGPGSFIGYMSLLEDKAYTESATALEDAEVAIIPKEDFMNLLHGNQDVSAQFVKMLANHIQENEQRLLLMAYGSVRERVADALLKQMEHFNSNEFAITRDDLASVVGVASETLIRMLSEFKEDAVISSKGRTITVLDKEKLVKLSSL